VHLKSRAAKSNMWGAGSTGPSF